MGEEEAAAVRVHWSRTHALSLLCFWILLGLRKWAEPGTIGPEAQQGKTKGSCQIDKFFFAGQIDKIIAWD